MRDQNLHTGRDVSLQYSLTVPTSLQSIHTIDNYEPLNADWFKLGVEIGYPSELVMHAEIEKAKDPVTKAESYIKKFDFIQGTYPSYNKLSSTSSKVVTLPIEHMASS